MREQTPNSCFMRNSLINLWRFNLNKHGQPLFKPYSLPLLWACGVRACVRALVYFCDPFSSLYVLGFFRTFSVSDTLKFHRGKNRILWWWNLTLSHSIQPAQWKYILSIKSLDANCNLFKYLPTPSTFGLFSCCCVFDPSLDNLSFDFSLSFGLSVLYPVNFFPSLNKNKNIFFRVSWKQNLLIFCFVSISLCFNRRTTTAKDAIKNKSDECKSLCSVG